MSTNTPAPTPLLGSTLFAYTNEWLAGQYDLEGMIREVAKRDLGPGLEIIGFQSFRGFPHMEDKDVRAFRDLLDELELIPTSLATNADVAIRRDPFQSEDESVAYLEGQIDLARRLGFPVARIQIGATAGVLEKLAPIAEKADVKLGMELHAPEGATTPNIMKVREAYERIGSGHLGFIPDFSATMTAIPTGMTDSFVRQGLPADLVAPLREIWAQDGTPVERFGRFAQVAAEAGVDPTLIGATRLAYTMFGKLDAASWAEIMPQVMHIHGKFYDIDSTGNEPSIPYAELMALLVEHDYTGSISSEWEGHAFLSVGDADAFDVVARHQAMQRRLLAEAAQ